MNKINKFKRNINGNILETYDHNDDNSINNSQYPKLINFCINNRIDHFEQLTKAVIMIQSIFDDTKINNILNIPIKWKIEYNLREKMREVKRK